MTLGPVAGAVPQPKPGAGIFMKSSSGPQYEAALVGLILVIQLIFLGLVADRQSPAGDERTFYLYGHRILYEGSYFRDDERMFNSKMPLQAIHALPQYLGEKVGLWPFNLLPEKVGRVNPKAPHRAYLWWARMAGAILVPVYSLVFYLWARRLYGQLPAICLLLFFGLSPNLTATWTLIVNDGMLVGFCLIALYLCRRYVAAPSAGRLIAAGVALGAAQLVKNTAVLLAIMVPAAWFLEKWPRIWAVIAGKNWGELARRSLKAGGVLAAWMAIGLMVINTGFGWQGFGATLAETKPVSSVFRDLHPALLAIPWPLPLEYLNGLDQLIFDDQNSLTIGRVYFNGLANHMGWVGYYPLGLLWKLPLPVLILFGLAVALKWMRRSTPDDAWLIAPMVILLLRMSFSNTVQLGIKYVLLAVPLMLLFSGRVLTSLGEYRAKAQISTTVPLLLWMVLTVTASYPHYISYFNDLISPEAKYRHLSLYDLSVGQGTDEAYEWAKTQKKEIAFRPPEPKPGQILVSAGDLLALHGPDHWRVLRESHRPLRTVAGEFLLFEADRVEPRQWTVVPEASRK